jgi:hypothetical protein
MSSDESGRTRTAGGEIEIVDRSHLIAAQRLMSDLSWLRREAGNPSLGELVKLSQHKLSKSTLDDHLAGRRTRVPPWKLVSAYVSACQSAAASTGLDIERLGTLEEWHALWAAALEGDCDAMSSIRLSSSTLPGPGTVAVPEMKVVDELPDHSDAGKTQILRGQGPPTGSIAPVLQRLEDDLSRLAKTMPDHTGLLVVTSGPIVGSYSASVSGVM